MIIQNKKILVIAPHLDDVELGLGGTIHKLQKKNTVYYIGLSLPPMINQEFFMQEFNNSAAYLKLKKEHMYIYDYDPRDLAKNRQEILQLFSDFNAQIQPDIVFLPNSHDIHQAHCLAHEEGVRAFKYCSILGYELPWNNFKFNMDVFIKLEKENVEAKQQSINCFHSQKDRMFFSNDIITDLAKLRGKQINREYAECFEIIRLII